MHAWIVATYEPLPDIDASARLLRCGMLSEQLLGDGDEVTWWTSTFHHVRKENRFGTSRSVASANGLRLELLHAPPYRRNASFQRVLHNRAMAEAFGARAREKAACPDIIFAAVPSLELAESAMLFAREAGVPIVVDARDKWPDVYLNAVPRVLRGVARHALRAEYDRARRIFHRADGITAISEDYLRWALQYAGRARTDRDAVVPLGFPVPDAISSAEMERRVLRLRRQLGIESDACIVTFLGMFGLSYDLECVVRAARVLHLRGDRALHIVLAGTGESEHRIRHLAVGLPNIHFPGWLDQADAWALLHASRAGLAPYRHDALQSLPNKGFEYMAAGLPVISSLEGELHSLLVGERVGISYRAGDADSLVSALLRIVTDPESSRQMGERALRLYQSRYSTNAIYRSLADHLRGVAAVHGHAVAGAASSRRALEGELR